MTEDAALFDDPYLEIIVDAARARGVAVEVVDRDYGVMRLVHGTRAVLTRGSLPDLTSAVAATLCDHKPLTRRVLEAAGLRVPRGRLASGGAADKGFLDEVGEVVVKPVRGEGGAGVTVGVGTAAELRWAISAAEEHWPEVLLEEFVPGQDLRVVVIDHAVVAAAVRRPATVTGDGRATIGELVSARDARLRAGSNGELRLPLDAHTMAAVTAAGHALDHVLAEGEALAVRRTANLHTGGEICDVTDRLHSRIAEACVRASQALAIPVVGLDLLVESPDLPEHVFIEANERPGLAYHEPQPTAERFLDLLFPETAGGQ